jgi:hypothetical protein
MGTTDYNLCYFRFPLLEVRKTYMIGRFLITGPMVIHVEGEEAQHCDVKVDVPPWVESTICIL